jgi:hypothetical protein
MSIFVGQHVWVHSRSIPQASSNVARCLLGRLVGFVFAGFRPFTSGNSLFMPELQSLSDFLKIPIETLRMRLDTTKLRCTEIGERYPRFQRPYRRRRRSLVQSALTLAGARLLSSCRRVLGADGASFATESRRAVLLFRTTSLGISCRILRFVLVLLPTEKLHWLDDIAIAGVLAVMRSVQRIDRNLDVEVSSIEAQRKGWDRVEAFGKAQDEGASLVLSDAEQEVSWVSPTCLSRLIFLATLRDNNTGQYRHPTLANKFPSDAVSRALTRIHRAACEELLRYPIADLVYELELYADQTRAERQNFLSTWKSTRAYRTVKPTELDPFSSLFFELTLDVAVAVLDSRGT